MIIEYRKMRLDEADAVAAMVRKLAADIGANTTPFVSGAALVENCDLIDITVADQAGRLIGACLTLMTFSTWRGTRGAYVVDLYVDGTARGHNVGQHLLRQAAKRVASRGAEFIKLEVDVSNEAAARFYRRLGFVCKEEDRLYLLEREDLAAFID
ncbi:MAG: GNAT family N-acetyltransferase [Rhizobiales bacterium]|nr:GNAT family N-acetyltransferase [Hyphomicrobiales bacterium]